MTSCIEEEIRLREKDLEKLRRNYLVQISGAEKHIEKLKEKSISDRAKVFVEKFGINPREIRESYINRLQNLCKSCVRGHYVKYMDIGDCNYPESRYYLYQDVINSRASHICLLSENLEGAALTEIEHAAFAVIGKKIWIDENPHDEIWGN